MRPSHVAACTGGAGDAAASDPSLTTALPFVKKTRRISLTESPTADATAASLGGRPFSRRMSPWRQACTSKAPRPCAPSACEEVEEWLMLRALCGLCSSASLPSRASRSKPPSGQREQTTPVEQRPAATTAAAGSGSPRWGQSGRQSVPKPPAPPPPARGGQSGQSSARGLGPSAGSADGHATEAAMHRGDDGDDAGAARYNGQTSGGHCRQRSCACTGAGGQSGQTSGEHCGQRSDSRGWRHISTSAAASASASAARASASASSREAVAPRAKESIVLWRRRASWRSSDNSAGPEPKSSVKLGESSAGTCPVDRFSSVASRTLRSHSRSTLRRISRDQCTRQAQAKATKPAWHEVSNARNVKSTSVVPLHPHQVVAT
mmetsp:Transcript_87084/g.281166  ORF Transcript_87084/g.281166 Transcript_87084/m.281166 type:complete len:378 (-) Transcript_87084:1140-2273(-)